MKILDLNFITINGYTSSAHIALTQTVQTDDSTGERKVTSSYLLLFNEPIFISVKAYELFSKIVVNMILSFNMRAFLEKEYINSVKIFKPPLRFSLI